MVKKMKTIFVLNPSAGKGHGLDRIKDEVSEASKKLGVKAGVYITKKVGDAESFARMVAMDAAEKNEEVRLIGCGGDGTLNELVNGVIGFDCAAVGVIPTGTGNDFVRNFKDVGDFMSVEAQLRGTVEKKDVIKYWGVLDGREQTRYCANMFNIGFDCNVVDLAATLKKYPMLKGSLAYLAAVMGILVKKKGANLKIEIDGEVVQNGPVLLAAVANGGYCGGGVNSAPKASLTDGLMDINIIYNITRLEFLKNFPAYAKGTHLELPNVEEMIYFKQCKKVVITPLHGAMRLCTDGELSDAGTVHMEIVEGGLNMVVPGK
jgi:YegS/Rv2252/BmrU family lipid kinase